MKKIYLASLPQCDMTGCSAPARYDAPTKMGPWAYLCVHHYDTTAAPNGIGSELVIGEEPERTDDDIRNDLLAAFESGDWDAMEDAIGDRDLAEFL